MTLKTFSQFLVESTHAGALVNEAKEGKSSISTELDGMMEPKWRIATIKKAFKEKHGDAWEKHEADVDAQTEKLESKYKNAEGQIPDDKKAEAKKAAVALRRELRDKFMEKEVYSKPGFKEELQKFYAQKDRFEELGNKLNDTGFDEFKKNNAAEYKELLDLQASYANPLQISSKPGGMMQISSANMEKGGDRSDYDSVELPADVGSDAFRRQMNTYIDKNGKPKGVIMDLRQNTGGSQEVAKAMTDYFVDGDDYEIEKQTFNYGPRIWKDDPDGLEKYKKLAWDQPVIDHLNTLDEKGQKEFWDSAVKRGNFELPNKRKNEVDSKYRLTGIPTVLQTSTRTFSAGEFASDTIKNLNTNVTHIGTNTGGGANQTSGGLAPDRYNEKGEPVWENGNKSPIEQAKLIAKGFKDSYHEVEGGQKIHDAILGLVKDGKITDKMSREEMVKACKENAIATSKDNHVDIEIMNDGSVFPLVPQVRSDRVVIDRKTGKPVLDKDGNPQFKGNWEQTGVGSAGTSPFVESDPNTATRDALAVLYEKTGQKKLAQELKDNPEKFGIGKDGKDGVFDDSRDSNKSYFATKSLSGGGGAFSQRQADQLEVSKKSAKETADVGILAKVKDAEKSFAELISGKEVKKEDVGLTKIFSGFDKKITLRLQRDKVPVKIPGKKPKLVQRQTLLDFVPIDRNDPVEMSMMLGQKQQYLLIQAAREKAKLKPLADYEIWIEKKFAMAKDNVEYQRRQKAALLRAANKGKDVKESYVADFTQFLGLTNK